MDITVQRENVEIEEISTKDDSSGDTQGLGGKKKYMRRR